MGSEKNHIIQALKDFKNSNPIDRVVFFGSFATGTQRKDSDVDVVVVSDVFENVTSYKRAPLFRRKIKLDYPVDLLCFTNKEFETKKQIPSVLRDAVRTGIEIR